MKPPGIQMAVAQIISAKTQGSNPSVQREHAYHMGSFVPRYSVAEPRGIDCYDYVVIFQLRKHFSIALWDWWQLKSAESRGGIHKMPSTPTADIYKVKSVF